MAQAGIHSMLGAAVRRWVPDQTWLMLGVVLGALIPDADNLAVAVATLAGWSTEGLHRTATHSLFFAAGIALVFAVMAFLTHQAKWRNLGYGLAVGVVMHILLDLIIWFDGVEILWPIPSWINLWANVTPPVWWSKLMLPVENLAFVGYFLLLMSVSNRYATDLTYQGKLRFWTAVQAVLFVVFLVLVYTMETGFMTIFGAVYLLSLALAIGITIRMRATVEAIG